MEKAERSCGNPGLVPTRSPALLLPALLAATAGCGVPPPRSQVPTGEDAIARMRASAACGYGVKAQAKIDLFGKQGRVRGDLMLYAVAASRIRMDAISSFNVALATLTSDGKRFALADLREKRFYVGPSTACNIARFAAVPIPGHALVGFLRGQAPVLKHDPATLTIEWQRKGHYLVRVPSTRNAVEEIRIAPHPDDLDKPWQEQRMRVVDVKVEQYGDVLYHAELEGHAPAPMSTAMIDEAGLDPPIEPSGPPCQAEIPRRVHLEVPGDKQDVLLRYDQVSWNPPLPDGVFQQAPPPGMSPSPVECAD